MVKNTGFRNYKKLAIEKYLILRPNHGYSIQEIKSLINATSVKKLDLSLSDDTEENFIDSTICCGIRAFHNTYTGDLDYYKVEGKEAASIFLKLKSEYFLSAISLSAKNLIQIRNACTIKDQIEFVKSDIEFAKSTHDTIFNELNKNKKYKKLRKNDKEFEKLVNGYGTKEIKNAMTTIEKLMKNSW